MRAVVLGLVGVLLASAVQAAECPAARLSFVKGGDVLQVEASAYAKRQVNGHGTERMLFRGRLSGTPYVIDIQSSQGSSASFDSYRGRTAETPGLPANWGAAATWPSNEPLEISTGPLAGVWSPNCRI